MLALAVALREVFPAAWTAQEVFTRSEAMQEVLVEGDNKLALRRALLNVRRG